jgi:hypothetical protein
MSIRNQNPDVWMQLASVGLLIAAFFMMLIPFLESVITNIGRRVPKSALRGGSRRMITGPRRMA